VRLIVVNPKGGAAIWRPRLYAAVRELRSQGTRCTMVQTKARDMISPVRDALRDNPGITQIVACGGDGTVAACAAALNGRAIPIGIVPTGTSNVLANELGLPLGPVRAARALAGRMRDVPFHTWSVNGRTMLLQLGVGFDGKLMWHTPRRLKNALGFIGVVLSALRQGLTFDYPEMRVEGELHDGTPHAAVVTSVMVANAKRWAGPPITVPDADPSDDIVDLLLLEYRNFGQLARFWIAILFPGAPHLRLPYVRHVRMRRATIEAVRRAVEAHLDGEPDLTTPLRIEPLGHVTLLGPA